MWPPGGITLEGILTNRQFVKSRAEGDFQGDAVDSGSITQPAERTLLPCYVLRLRIDSQNGLASLIPSQKGTDCVRDGCFLESNLNSRTSATLGATRLTRITSLISPCQTAADRGDFTGGNPQIATLEGELVTDTG